MVTRKIHDALGALTSLGDPVRRQLYEAVVAEGRPISRNELAVSTGVARPLVAYHLDRLVKDGLLAVRFERQTGKTGPGAGRPAKLYFRPRPPVQLTLPPRDYELAARVLVEAVARRPDEEMSQVLDELAQEMGGRAAREEREARDDSAADALKRLLLERGYEPQQDAAGGTWLRNCVFDELADQQRQLVCGMNLSLLKGMLKALPEAGMEARLQPAAGRCCVVLLPAGSEAEGLEEA